MKPNWCKDAVATNRGWIDPKTGELLVAVKGLKIESIKEEVKEMLVEPILEKVELKAKVLMEPVIENTKPITEYVEMNDEPSEDDVIEKPKRKRKK